MIEERILSGDYLPGSALQPERSLAAELGVSRNIVREALKALGERGLVTAEQGRGTYVTPNSSGAGSGAMSAAVLRRGATPRELIEGRIALEVSIAELAAERRDDDLVEALRAMNHSVVSSAPIGVRAAADLELHRLIAQACGNVVLLTMFESIERFAFDMMLRSHADPSVADHHDSSHHDIVEAIAAGDGPAAAAAMRKHLLVAEQWYGPDLDRPLRELASTAFRAPAPTSRA